MNAIKTNVREDLGRLRDMLYKNLLLVLGGLFLFLLILLFFEVLPSQQLASDKEKGELSSKEFYELRNGIHQTFAQAVGGAILLIGLYFTARTLWTTREGQITDRFTKAIDQLGKTGRENLATRLGGIYALERIARDSERDHGPIMEVLTAYVREHAPLESPKLLADDFSLVEKSSAEKDQLFRKPAADIQAILTVISRHTQTPERNELPTGYDWGPRRLDLSKTDLSGATLIAAHLEEVVLMEANLTRADLMMAHMERAYAFSANLQGARLVNSFLDGALFGGANFEGAILQGASLARAELVGAKITVAQLCSAKTLYKAELDPSLKAQVERKCPLLLEMPR